MASRIRHRSRTSAEGMAEAKTLRRNGLAEVPQQGHFATRGHFWCHTGVGVGAVTELWWDDNGAKLKHPVLEEQQGHCGCSLTQGAGV